MADLSAASAGSLRSPWLPRTAGTILGFGPRQEGRASVASTLPDGASALVVTHGGLIEAGIVAIAGYPRAAKWGRRCRTCEGAHTFYGDEGVGSVEPQRIPKSLRKRFQPPTPNRIDPPHPASTDVPALRYLERSQRAPTDSRRTLLEL